MSVLQTVVNKHDKLLLLDVNDLIKINKYMKHFCYLHTKFYH